MSLSIKDRASLLLAVCALLGTGLGAPPTQAQARGGEDCVSAAIADIDLGTFTDVDEIRVQLATSSPREAAVEVTVETLDSDRVVAIEGQSYKALRFAPAMSSAEYRISLFPDQGKQPACVHSVELMSQGSSVAYFRP